MKDGLVNISPNRTQMRFATQLMSLIQMDEELKLNNMDKDLLALRHDYEYMIKAINKNTERNVVIIIKLVNIMLLCEDVKRILLLIIK